MLITGKLLLENKDICSLFRFSCIYLIFLNINLKNRLFSKLLCPSFQVVYAEGLRFIHFMWIWFSFNG